MGSALPVIVVGRQPLFRLGVGLVVSRIGRYSSVEEFSGVAKLEQLNTCSPGLLIICRDLYHHFDLQELQRFHKVHPYCPILVLTEVLGAEDRKLAKLGVVSRFLPMSVSAAQLEKSLLQLQQSAPIGPPAASRCALEDDEEAFFLPDLNDLTRRERECLHHIQAGHSNKLIAYHFGVSENCVKHHLTSIFHKTKFRNRTDMAVAAQQLVAAFNS